MKNLDNDEAADGFATIAVKNPSHCYLGLSYLYHLLSLVTSAFGARISFGFVVLKSKIFSEVSKCIGG